MPNKKSIVQEILSNNYSGLSAWKPRPSCSYQMKLNKDVRDILNIISNGQITSLLDAVLKDKEKKFFTKRHDKVL